MSRGKVLFQLSGSISCFKACGIISRLVQSGFEVEVVATKAALEFVGRATFEGLTGRPVHTEMFASGEYMNHIDLMKWADLSILCPATANTIAKLANGLGDDLVSALFLAHDFKKPYLIAPAMNVNMLSHPATRTALGKLREWGVDVLDTEAGRLACGDTGEGRLLDPEIIYNHIAASLESSEAKPLEGRKILVTAGGTREPLDGVRFLTNVSSGATGATIADRFAAAGAEVTYLHAAGSQTPRSALVRPRNYSSYVSLKDALLEELANTDFHAVIHAAAVGDFSIDSIETENGVMQADNAGKLDSSGPIRLNLKKNPKLLTSLREWSRNKAVKIVGFKLTNSSSAPASRGPVEKLLQESEPDWVVQNDLSQIVGGRHPFRVYGREAKAPRLLTEVDGAANLANFLIDALTPGGHA